MPRTCTICRHPQRTEIEAALLRSDSYRHIATRFDTSTGALQRHRAEHLGEKLQQARELQKTEDASDLVARLQEIHRETAAILARAKKSKDWATALRAITRLERQIELEAELLGELDHRGAGVTTVQVVYVDKLVTAGSRPVIGGNMELSTASSILHTAAEETGHDTRGGKVDGE